MSNIEYISQSSLLEYLKLLYTYIKSKFEQSQDPNNEPVIPPRLIIDGKKIDGNWSITSFNNTNYYEVKEFNQEGIYLNNVKQLSDVNLKTCISNYLEIGYYYAGSSGYDYYQHCRNNIFVKNNDLYAIDQNYNYNGRNFGIRKFTPLGYEQLSNTVINGDDCYYWCVNNKIYKGKYNSNYKAPTAFSSLNETDYTWSSAVNIIPNDPNAGNTVKSGDTYYSFVVYNNELLCINCFTNKSTNKKEYNIYKIDIDNGTKTLKYNIPSSYTENQKGFYCIFVYNNNLYGAGILDTSASSNQKRVVYKLVNNSFVLDNEITLPTDVDTTNNNNTIIIGVDSNLYLINCANVKDNYCYNGSNWKKIASVYNKTFYGTYNSKITYPMPVVYNRKLYLCGSYSNRNPYCYIYNEDDDIWNVATLSLYELVQ